MARVILWEYKTNYVSPLTQDPVIASISLRMKTKVLIRFYMISPKLSSLTYSLPLIIPLLLIPLILSFLMAQASLLFPKYARHPSALGSLFWLSDSNFGRY